MTAKETVKAICEALIEKKAQGIEVLHVERLTELTEYFVICSASSTTQVKALADNVEWHLKYDHDEMPHHTEGYESAQWMLLDYGCVVVHVFSQEAREFYGLRCTACIHAGGTQVLQSGEPVEGRHAGNA